MPAWNPKLESDKENAETLTPNRSQAMSMTAKGRRQSPVNAVETSAGGRFSGSLNKCRISGLGLLGASLRLSFPLSAATIETKNLKMIEGHTKKD